MTSASPAYITVTARKMS